MLNDTCSKATTLFALLAAVTLSSISHAQLVPATSRVDMAFDNLRGILYIGNSDELVRYRLSDQTLLTPIPLGGFLRGMDISPDGSTLAVADDTYVGTENFVHLLDLETGTINSVAFTRDFGEGGLYSVAWGNDGALLITGQYLGSGWVPMRHYDPATATLTILPDVRQRSMLTASADRSVIGYEESNISSGPVGRYRVSDANLLENSGTSRFNFEIGVERTGAQFAVPTNTGCFIYDGALQAVTTVGGGGGPRPIGVVYHPTDDIVYFAWDSTTEVRAHDITTFAVLDTYDVGFTLNYPSNQGFRNGRLKISGDGSKLFCAATGAVRIISLTNSAPVARDDDNAGTTDANQVLSGLSSLTDNDLDYDFGTVLTLTAFDSTSAQGASVLVNPDGTFTYDPTLSLSLLALAVGDSIQDTFTYTISDGTLNSTATVTITVNGSDPLPPVSVPVTGAPALVALIASIALTACQALRRPLRARYTA